MAAPEIIDIHMHIYRTREWGLRRKQTLQIWEYGDKPDMRFTQSSGSPQEAVDDIEEAGFSRVVVANLFAIPQAIDFAVSSLPDGISEEERARAIKEIESSPGRLLKEFNTWACDLARANPRLIPFIAADPIALPGEAGAAHVREMVEGHGARGVKLHPVLQDFDMGDPRMWPVYETCQELRIPILAHSGPARDRRPYAEPRAFAPVLEAFPKLTIIIAHLGGGAWEQALEIARAYPNAYFDCCEIIEWTGGTTAPTDDQLARLIKDIGPQRVMMGSDYPFYDLRGSVERVMDLPLLSQEEKEAMLGANALRILGL